MMNTSKLLLCRALFLLGSVYLQTGPALALPEGLRPGLTPLGADQSGNAEATIPAWQGGITQPPPGYQPGQAHIDPFAKDQRLFQITATNRDKFTEKLSGIDQAMLAKYPDSYRLNVYPTRRSCAFPNFVYDALQHNAANAKLLEDGNGVDNAIITSPFPLPKSGFEVYWNHNLHFRGYKVAQKITGGTVSNGNHTRVVREDIKLGHYYNPELTSWANSDKKEMDWLAIWSAPARLAGAGFSMTNPVSFSNDTRTGFLFRPETRKVSQAPASAVSFDSPLSSGQGTRISDDMFLGNGSPERYDWTLIGKKELYIPYNAYKASQTDLNLSDLLHAQHLNPDLLRYELHRVWVIEARLKADFNHLYHRRVLYIDEDSWIAVAADLYDERDELVAGQLGFIKNYYEVPTCMQEFDVKYLIELGRYNIDNVKIEFGPANMNADLKINDFGASALRRAIAR